MARKNYWAVDDGHQFCGHAHNSQEAAEKCRERRLRAFWRSGDRPYDSAESMHDYVRRELERIWSSGDGSDIQIVCVEGDNRTYIK